MKGPYRDEAIAKFVKQALEDGVIVPSDAPSRSQVLLTKNKKPDGTWRFRLDYRILNRYTKSKGWPIPNIKEMLARIGARRPQ
jgi:hypothetical protein